MLENRCLGEEFNNPESSDTFSAWFRLNLCTIRSITSMYFNVVNHSRNKNYCIPAEWRNTYKWPIGTTTSVVQVYASQELIPNSVHIHSSQFTNFKQSSQSQKLTNLVLFNTNYHHFCNYAEKRQSSGENKWATINKMSCRHHGRCNKQY